MGKYGGKKGVADYYDDGFFSLPGIIVRSLKREQSEPN